MSNGNNYNNGNVGIYIILQIITGRAYVGGTTNLNERFEKQHVPLLNKNKHSNRELQSDWNKYGADAFICLIIEQTTTEKLKERETKHIRSAKEKDIAYNVKSGASGPISMSEETRTKMSEAKMGSKHPNYGKPRYEGSGRKPKCYKFMSPAGEIVDAIGLKELSLEYDLTISNLSKLANGKIKEYKGWSRVNELPEDDFRC